MPDQLPLCPALYSRIERHLGKITIASAGMAMRAHYVPEKRADGSTGRRLVVENPGEYYRVDCPKCGDTRKRLWINHRFSEFPTLAICYNEGCYHSTGARHQLHAAIMNSRAAVKLPVAPGRVDNGPVVARWPGECVPLTSLPWEHEAVQYLHGRGYDVASLTRQYDLRLCTGSEDFPIARNRIILPLYMKGQLVGWQARFPGDRNWKACPFPKYWDMPGMPKRQILYNYDVAVQLPWVVLVEGAADVWSVGPHAMALLGKSLSYTQGSNFGTERLRDKPVLVMMDGEAYQDTLAIAEELQRVAPGRRPVIPIQLPPGSDPGDFDPSFHAEFLRQEAFKRGVTLE